MNDSDRIAEIRSRADAATAGPWHGPHDPDIDLCARFGDYGWTAGSPDGNGPEYDVDSEQGKADAEFIAHAREDVPFLLDQLEQARTEAADARNVAWNLHESIGDIVESNEQLEGERDRARAAAVALEQDAASGEEARQAWAKAAQEQLAEARAELVHERSLSRRLASEGTVMATAIQRVRNAHTESNWYRAPGHDRLWPSKDDAAYYNAPNETFTANDVETVTICGECSGEDEWPSTVSTADYKAVTWPCATITALGGEVPDGN